MSHHTSRRPCLVTARRAATLSGLAALATAGALSSSGAMVGGDALALHSQFSAGDQVASLAGGEGEGEGDAVIVAEGEGEGAVAASSPAAFLSGLAFMEGHMTAGLALYEEGDLAAAKTHIGHPIKEKYDAVAKGLEQAGFGNLKAQISDLAAAAEAEAEFGEIERRFAKVRKTLAAVRADFTAFQQAAGLIDLTRVAGAEYAVAVDGGQISNLHEYQDSWGFLRVVEAEARKMTKSDDTEVAGVGQAFIAQIEVTNAVFGDLQGKGLFRMEPSVIYGAAARMELAAARLVQGNAEGAGSGHAEGEGESN